MIGVLGRFLGVFKLTFIGLILLCVLISNSDKVSAYTVSSGTTTVSAVVAPVRDILVNTDGNIVQIASNTPENVTPTVFMKSFETPPIPLTTKVFTQYLSLLSNINKNSMGIIYPAPNVPSKKSGLLTAWLKLGDYESTLLFRADTN
jgi:hypothetical protein